MLGSIQLLRLICPTERLTETLLSTHTSMYLTIMFPALRYCPVGSHTEFFLPHLNPLCLCHQHPAHLLRNANSLVLAIPFRIFHQPVNDSSQLPCMMWQVPSLYPYRATILRIVMVWSLQARTGNLSHGYHCLTLSWARPILGQPPLSRLGCRDAEGQLSFGEAIWCSSSLGLEVPVGRL